MEKNEAQISGFAVEKKNCPPYLRRYDLQNGVHKFLLNKWVSRYLSFGDVNVPENGSSQ